ncbi:MAG: hypothetical protein R2856_10760 [Caldilineaceae bacterium]
MKAKARPAPVTAAGRATQATPVTVCPKSASPGPTTRSVSMLGPPSSTVAMGLASSDTE